MENVVICGECVVVKKKRKNLCIHEGCVKHSSFNFIGETNPKYCAGHKEPTMVDVISKRCEHENCNKHPSCNYENKKGVRFCDEHKLPEMVNVLSKRCEHESCNKIAIYNLKGNKIGGFCAGHKKPEMVNVVSKLCEHDDCYKRPAFNYPDKKGGILCDEHKKTEMVNVVNKKCDYDGCNKSPKFNYPDKNCGKSCVKHKTPDMVNVVHKKCNHDGCNKIANFNYENVNTGLRCNEHKDINMVDVINKRCNYEGCNVRPSYNLKNKKRGFLCVKHKDIDMVNVIDKTCLHEWCYTTVRTKKQGGYCVRCYIDVFPDEPLSRNCRTKEVAVAEFIKLNFPNNIWFEDKIISGGCSRRRPDLLLYLDEYVIIIEIDENRHINYDNLSDIERTVEILQDLKQKPTVFIRFNPDNYKIGNKRITSCWGFDKNGVCIVKKSKELEWNERLNALKECVESWMKNKPVEEVENIKMFYDEI